MLPNLHFLTKVKCFITILEKALEEQPFIIHYILSAIKQNNINVRNVFDDPGDIGKTLITNISYMNVYNCVLK